MWSRSGSECKRCAETLFFNFHRQHGLDIKIARIFNTYGPRMNAGDGRVVSNFIIQALTGEQTRSFCFVDDLVEGLLRLMDTPADFPGPVNLGDEVEFPIRELAKQVIELTGSASEVVSCPLPEDDPRQRQPDAGLAREVLDWEATTRLRDGLRRTIDYFEALLKQKRFIELHNAT